MKKQFIITASALMIAGAAIFTAALASVNFDFKQLSGEKYEMKTVNITESFENISIEAVTANIKFVQSDNEACRAELYEDKKFPYSVETENGTLIIRHKDERRWYDHIGFSFKTPKITLYLPAGTYGELSVLLNTGDTELPAGFDFEAVNISATTGHITLEGTNAATLELSTSTGHITASSIRVQNSVSIGVSTGDVVINDLSCQSFTAKASTGDTVITGMSCDTFSSNASTGKLTLKNVTVAGKFYAKRDTGDVSFESFDASEIVIKTSTGDVKGTLLSAIPFDAKTSTGKVRVPHTDSESKNKITTDTGDIIISIQK